MHFNNLIYAPKFSPLNHTEILQSTVRSNDSNSLDTTTHFTPKIREMAFFL